MTSEGVLREMADGSSRYRQPTDATDKIACRHGAEALALLRRFVATLDEGSWPVGALDALVREGHVLLAGADHD